MNQPYVDTPTLILAMDLSNAPSSMSVPLRQCLVINVMYGESHQLPVELFGPDVVSRVVLGITGECPEKILHSPTADILLVFASEVDVNRVKVQLECQASWMGKPIHLRCVRPSGTELKQFGVLGTVMSPARAKGCHLKKEGDASLELPFFSGKTTPEGDEVTFGQWLSVVEGALQTCSSAAVHNWIYRSVREPAAEVVRNLGVGAPLDKILCRLKTVNGTVCFFGELMINFLNMFQHSNESVTDYVVRLENAFAFDEG